MYFVSTYKLLCVQVPSLEHNNKVIGESLDIIKYIDANFKGPSLFPDVSIVFELCTRIIYSRLIFKCEVYFQDPAKREFGEQLLAYADTFISLVVGSYKGDVAKEAGECLNFNACPLADTCLRIL